MGEHNIEQQADEQKAQAFMKALLEDLRALAFMLHSGQIESGITRIGAEQEMFLVDRHLRPAPVSLEVLKEARDSLLVTRDWRNFRVRGRASNETGISPR